MTGAPHTSFLIRRSLLFCDYPFNQTLKLNPSERKARKEEHGSGVRNNACAGAGRTVLPRASIAAHDV